MEYCNDNSWIGGLKIGKTFFLPALFENSNCKSFGQNGLNIDTLLPKVHNLHFLKKRLMAGESAIIPPPPYLSLYLVLSTEL